MSRLTVILISILMGTFLVPINSTMIAVALPEMAQSFQIEMRTVTWLVTIYLIIIASMISISGKLGDVFGNRNLFLMGLLLFGLGSFGAVFAFNFTSLLICRSIQALGASLMVPNASASIRRLIEKEQLTKVFGTYGMFMGLGAAIGPLVGGFLIGFWGWQSVFWINIPFVFISFIMSIRFLPKFKKDENQAFNIFGSVLLFLTLVSFVSLLSLEHLSLKIRIAFSIVCTILFLLEEKKSKIPIMDINMFKLRSFTGANISIFSATILMYGTILYFPNLFNNNYGYSPKMIGMLLFAFSLTMALSSFLGGKASKLLKEKNMIILAFFLSTLAITIYSFFSIQQSIWLQLFALMIGGIGAGLGLPSMQALNLNDVPEQKAGQASGVYATSRYFGGIIASILSGIFLLNNSFLYILIGIAIFGIINAICVFKT